jgi:hypothetical protein
MTQLTQVYKQYKDFVLIRLFTAVFLQVIGCKLKIPDCSSPVLGADNWKSDGGEGGLVFFNLYEYFV